MRRHVHRIQMRPGPDHDGHSVVYLSDTGTDIRDEKLVGAVWCHFERGVLDTGTGEFVSSSRMESTPLFFSGKRDRLWERLRGLWWRLRWEWGV